MFLFWQITLFGLCSPKTNCLTAVVARSTRQTGFLQSVPWEKRWEDVLEKRDFVFLIASFLKETREQKKHHTWNKHHVHLNEQHLFLWFELGQRKRFEFLDFAPLKRIGPLWNRCRQMNMIWVKKEQSSTQERGNTEGKTELRKPTTGEWKWMETLESPSDSIHARDIGGGQRYHCTGNLHQVCGDTEERAGVANAGRAVGGWAHGRAGGRGSHGPTCVFYSSPSAAAAGSGSGSAAGGATGAPDSS